MSDRCEDCDLLLPPPPEHGAIRAVLVQYPAQLGDLAATMHGSVRLRRSEVVITCGVDAYQYLRDALAGAGVTLRRTP